MVKLKTRLKRKYGTKKYKLPLYGWMLVAGVGYYMSKSGRMPTLMPTVSAQETAPVVVTPSVSYAYDAYPPIRNEPYYNTSQFFGPADGDPVFYGVPGVY
tara:strand:- start:250 stop:549 length:300 start_codon:yes stop_codon:yes gene_type:complete